MSIPQTTRKAPSAGKSAAIIKATTKPIVRPTGPKQPSLATRNRERLKAVAEYCDLPASELQEMFLAAAMDAIQPGMESRGRLTLPLSLAIADEEGEGMLPIYFPADDVRLIREICEAEGSQSGDKLAREMIHSIARSSLDSDTGSAAHLAYGVLDAQSDFDDEGVPNPDLAALERMQAVVDRWNAKVGVEGRADA